MSALQEPVAERARPVATPLEAVPQPNPESHDAPISLADLAVALLALVGILVHLPLRFWHASQLVQDIPLLCVLIVGGGALVVQLAWRVVQGKFGSDLLAGISIVASACLNEYLAGAIVVLMLSGGQALEAYAVRRASSLLKTLARRMPTIAHRRVDSDLQDIAVEKIVPGDFIVVLPHETCPADGTVLEGNGAMDESYLTGEPYRVPKAPGSEVLSGAVNGESALVLQVSRRPADSRYARIMRVMRDAEQERPRMRRLADRLGAWYTPTAVGVAIGAWAVSANAHRFLAVLVVATPCPLLIAIPVAIMGTISLAARRGIVIRDPAVLERLTTCQTVFFDKTGTLTYGRPQLVEVLPAAGMEADEILPLVAGLEQYSRHPLARAIQEYTAAHGIPLVPATDVSEQPGRGLTGSLNDHRVTVTGRDKVPEEMLARLLPNAGGLECIVLIDGRYAATLRFEDEARPEVKLFVMHLGPRHRVTRTILLTGDQETEARRVAGYTGITEVYAGKSPEEKLEIVREATRSTTTLYLGDGVNDAPAMLAATAAVAFGTAYDVTSEAAGAVILEPSLEKLDELLHIARHLRAVALTAAGGGMALSLIAVGFAAAGMLPPIAGAMLQEFIDLAAVLYALRAAVPPKSISDLSD